MRAAEEYSENSNSSYEELIRSLPHDEHTDILFGLNSRAVVERAELLCSELVSNDHTIGLKLDESRTLFLAALRNLKFGKITAAQLATLHIFDSAVRTLYTQPCMYLIYNYVVDNGVQRTNNIFALPPS